MYVLLTTRDLFAVYRIDSRQRLYMLEMLTALIVCKSHVVYVVVIKVTPGSMILLTMILSQCCTFFRMRLYSTKCTARLPS